MGRRSGSETALAIVAAFHAEATWEQSELAKRVGVEVRTLRRALDDLARFGVPIEQEAESHSRVYWSVPASWGRTLDADEVSSCVRLLMRLPATRDRDALLARYLRAPPIAVVSDGEDERIKRTLEDGAAQRIAIRLLYRSTTDGALSERHVSVQRMLHGDRCRVVAVCHRSSTLKWFRVDRAESAALDAREPFFVRTEDEIRAFVADGVGGYRGDGPARVVRFFVRDPEARWALDDLAHERMTLQRTGDGVDVALRTTALLALARRLVGLGAAVRIATPELRDAVMALARASLAAEMTAKPLARAGRQDRAGRSVTRGGAR